MKAYKKQIELVKRQVRAASAPKTEVPATQTRAEMTPNKEARIRFMQNIIADARVRG